MPTFPRDFLSFELILLPLLLSLIDHQRSKGSIPAVPFEGFWLLQDARGRLHAMAISLRDIIWSSIPVGHLCASMALVLQDSRHPESVNHPGRLLF